MAERVAGIRFEPNGPLVFCHAGALPLERGQRVRVDAPGGAREGVVAIPPDAVIAAPPLGAAPRVLDAAAPAATDAPVPSRPTAAGTPVPTLPADVVFLAADGESVGLADLARALALADLPVPEPPPERR